MSHPLLLVFALFTLNPVTISVYPQVGTAPATFRLTVLVPRHLENREVCFGYRGAEDKQSCTTLDGWAARRTWTVYWPIRTAGEYRATADLTRVEDGKTRHYVSTQPFRVIGPGSALGYSSSGRAGKARRFIVGVSSTVGS